MILIILVCHLGECIAWKRDEISGLHLTTNCYKTKHDSLFGCDLNKSEKHCKATTSQYTQEHVFQIHQGWFPFHVILRSLSQDR